MKKLFLAFTLLLPILVGAQTFKTDVLVIGSKAAAFGAGLQAFQSGVSTTILTQRDGLMVNGDLSSKRNKSMQAFEKVAKKSLKLTDTATLPPLNFQQFNAILKNWTDTTKRFKWINQANLTKVERSGNGWEVKLSNNRTIKAKILVLTELFDQVKKDLNINTLTAAKWSNLSFNNNLYRTSIASSQKGGAKYLSLNNLLVSNQENLLCTEDDDFEMGTSAGATAAYAADLKTETSLSNLKGIQGKLLGFKNALLPLADIMPTDSNWLAIQKITLTGILKPEIKAESAYFNPSGSINYDEIKQPIKDYYYKAQLWFDNHKTMPVDLGNIIAMVCYVGNTAVDATSAALEKNWENSYKFKTKFDLKKTVTRREFAVIVADYLKPFDRVNVDKTGQIIR